MALRDGQVDAAATGALRSRRALRQTEYAFGPEREAFEAVWSDAMQLALNRSLMTYPLSLRNYLKQRTMREVDARAGRGDCPAPERIAEIVRALHARMGGVERVDDAAPARS